MDVDGLDRLPDERPAAFAALCEYATMPRPRSLRRLALRYREQGGGPSFRTLDKWSGRYQWQQRVALFDVAEAERRVEVWQERRTELKESDWQDGARVRKKVMDYLNLAGEAGELVKLAQALKVASELQRLAADEPTAKLDLSGAALDALLEREFGRLAGVGYAAQAGAGGDADADADAE